MGFVSRASYVGFFLVTVVTVLAASQPAQAQWQIQPIVPIPSGGPSTGAFNATPAMTFDGQNRPHVAYLPASGNVVHAYGSALGAPGIWTIQNAAPSFSGPGVIHLAATGNSVYMGGSPVYSGQLVSGVFDGTIWQPYTTTGGPSYTNSILGGLATDTAGDLNWIIWPRMILSLYPYNPGGTTQPSPPDTGGKLFVPTVATPTIGYYLARTGTNGEIKRITPVAAGVAPVNTPSPSSSRSEDALRLDGDVLFDSTGKLHTLQYCAMGGSGILVYARGPADGPFEADRNVDSDWSIRTGKAGLAVDAAGKPHIVYTTLWPYCRLNYLTLAGDHWQRQTIEAGSGWVRDSYGHVTNSGYTGTFPKILIDLGGTVHVVYVDGLNGLLRHAKLMYDQWQIETVDTVGMQGLHSAQTGALAAAMDSVGGIGVTYWDADDGMLKYAYLAP